MSLPGGNLAWVAVAMLFPLGGCVSHDQVHLHNPSPCRVHCHADYVAPMNPECHGYHPTCWMPWSCNCPACPPPEVAVAPPMPYDAMPLERFQIVPEEVKVPDQILPQREEVPSPDSSREGGGVSRLVPKGKYGGGSTLKVVHANDNDDAPAPPDVRK